MGVDTLIRHVLVAPRTLHIYGPPGIVARFASKLGSYDWNLAEDFWCSFEVHEIHRDKIRSVRFSGPQGFSAVRDSESARGDGAIYANRYLRVDADFVDHKLPVLIFRITEQPGFCVDEKRLAAAGLLAGPWIRELKKRFFSGELKGLPLPVTCREGEGVKEKVICDAAALYEHIRALESPASIGYFSDLGFNAPNRLTLTAFLQGVTLLIGECSYLAQDVERARASSHLCSCDVNTLLEELQPAFFLPMHLSKSYLGQSSRLFDELKPPAGTSLLQLPERLTPRPLIPAHLPPAARGRC